VGEEERTGCGGWFSFLFRFRESWHLRGDRSRRGDISQDRRLEWTPMQPRHLQKVFLFDTFDACILGMGSQGHIGLSEPVVQGLGMNPKQTSTGC
jgi:6-phosphogluconolactonase/glucosamine-6-phosphate isomerase/deaminase